MAEVEVPNIDELKEDRANSFTKRVACVLLCMQSCSPYARSAGTMPQKR